MEPNHKYIMQLIRARDWNGSEFARQMGISRAEANRFLNGKRKGGKKLIGGLLKAFPDESVETLFILPSLSPNVNTKQKQEAEKVLVKEQIGYYQVKQNKDAETMTESRQEIRNLDDKLVCCIDETNGTVEIVKKTCVTSVHIQPDGSVEVRHVRK